MEFVKKNFHIILIILVIILIIYGFISSNINYNRLLKYPKYTIAYIVSDWHHKGNTGVGVDYVYYVNNKKYNYTINLNLKKNEKYLLVYDSLKPDNCRILDIYPFIHNNIIVPLNGWKYEEVPMPIDSIEIKEYIKSYE